MGFNLMLTSLTTPVHLLTPQSINGFGGHREVVLLPSSV